MQEFNDKTAPHQLSFEAYGLAMRFCTNSEDILERVKPLLPPGWRRCPRSATASVFGILEEEHDIYSIYRDDGMCTHDAPGREYALTVFESQLAATIAIDAPDFITTHAGVVAVGGQAIVMPGLSFSGKTTLTRALVQAGATYYSDEYAMFDEDGRVHPYARHLAFRPPEGEWVAHPVEDIGGVAGTEPIPVGMVVITHYRPGGEWNPRELSPGAGALALMEHTIPAELRPAQSMRALKRAVAEATILEGERGEAALLAEDLLETLRAAA